MKAVGFDLGDTLIYYGEFPLNWSDHYREALRKVAQELSMSFDDHLFSKAEIVLSRYNTRLHPRDYEVKDTEIFSEILQEWNLNNECLDSAITAFCSYHRARRSEFPS